MGNERLPMDLRCLYTRKGTAVHVFHGWPTCPSAPEGLLYRGTSLVRNCLLLGPYCRAMPGALRWSEGGGAVSYERGTPVNVFHDKTSFVRLTLWQCMGNERLPMDLRCLYTRLMLSVFIEAPPPGCRV